MKQNEVKVGMPVMLSLGRKGATRVRVEYRSVSDAFGVEWGVRHSDGQRDLVSARRLSRVPVTDHAGKFIGWEDAL